VVTSRSSRDKTTKVTTFTSAGLSSIGQDFAVGALRAQWAVGELGEQLFIW